MFLVSYDQKIPFSSIKSGLVVFRFFLKSSDLLSYKKTSHWITLNYPMLASVRKSTCPSAAENLNKEYLIYGKGKYKN